MTEFIPGQPVRIIRDTISLYNAHLEKGQEGIFESFHFYNNTYSTVVINNQKWYIFTEDLEAVEPVPQATYAVFQYVKDGNWTYSHDNLTREDADDYARKLLTANPDRQIMITGSKVANARSVTRTTTEIVFSY